MLRRLFVVLLALSPWTAPLAVGLRVGTDASCDYANLGSALTSIEGEAGTHYIRISKGSYPVPNGIQYTPNVNQTAVYLEGGYSDCGADLPSGDPTLDAHRAVFDGAGGAAASVLSLEIYGRVDSIQIRRIALINGDATYNYPANDYYESGGGMIVRGQASVLLGLGASIRNNAAINGGGVALAGSYWTDTSMARAALFIDEGAEIRNNVADNLGGGIYCGGQNQVPSLSNIGKHLGSIVLRDGVISYNTASTGGAFFCHGTLEGGGGFQPRPQPGRFAWIHGNEGNCGAGDGTLDTALPIVSGFRFIGADAGSNGLLAITANGNKPGLCLHGSRSYLAINDPPPIDGSRFWLRNLYVSNQSGSGILGLKTSNRLELVIEPASDTVTCNFFTPTPCVRFTENSIGDSTGDSNLLSADAGSELELRRAKIDGNDVRSDLAFALGGSRISVTGSIFDDNTVANRTQPPNTSALFAANETGSSVVISNSTVIMRSQLTQFFRLGWTPFGAIPTGVGEAYASAFASTFDAPLAVGLEGGAPASNFHRYWSGYFANISGFAGHTIHNDPLTLTYTLAATFAVDANYSPTTPDLRDANRVPYGTTNHDFYGRPYNVVYEPGSPAHADIGAVEAQLLDDIFKNGFET